MAWALLVTITLPLSLSTYCMAFQGSPSDTAASLFSHCSTEGSSACFKLLPIEWRVPDLCRPWLPIYIGCVTHPSPSPRLIPHSANSDHTATKVFYCWDHLFKEHRALHNDSKATFSPLLFQISLSHLHSWPFLTFKSSSIMFNIYGPALLWTTSLVLLSPPRLPLHNGYHFLESASVPELLTLYSTTRETAEEVSQKCSPTQFCSVPPFEPPGLKLPSYLLS